MSVGVSEGGTGQTSADRQLAVISASSPSPTQLVWREPPPGRRRRVLTPQIVAALRANPGRWAAVREYTNRTAVKGRPLMPKHPVDIELRGVEEPPGSVLYARAKPLMQSTGER